MNKMEIQSQFLTKNNTSTLVNALYNLAVEFPQHILYVMDETGNCPVSLTAAQLFGQARAIAGEISTSAKPGDRVLLIYPHNLDFISGFMGCLLARVVAVPVFSINLRSPALFTRLDAIINDSGASLVLTTHNILDKQKQLTDKSPQLNGLPWLATDTMAGITDLELPAPVIDPGSIAFLQYTSGSTGIPKGVIVKHSNLMSNLGLIHNALGLVPESTAVSWLPMYHDMGLIGSILGVIFARMTLYLLTPQDFIKDPFKWLSLVSRTRARVSGGPNFAYDLCLKRITDKQRETLDLSCWEVAFNGAEPVRSSTIQDFSSAFAVCGFRREAFYPCYGLAEATLMVSCNKKNTFPGTIQLDRTALAQGKIQSPVCKETMVTLVSSGQICPGLNVGIFNRETGGRHAPGEIGEICIQGASVCTGYWQKPMETEKVFDIKPDQPGKKPFLHTGDLGFIDDNNLYITGRLKDLIIIHGRNHYPEDIEATVNNAHPQIRHRRAAAFSYDRENREKLAVLIELPQHFKYSRPELAEAVCQAVLKHHRLEITDLNFVLSGTLPVTSSGKIQRYQCKQAFIENRLQVVEHYNRPGVAEQKPSSDADTLSAAEIRALEPDIRFATLLLYIQVFLSQELNIPIGKLGMKHSLAFLGLDSLTVVRLEHQIQTWTGMSIPPDLLFGDITLPGLARKLSDCCGQDIQDERILSGRDEPVPLSYGQKALYFLHQLAPESTAYNIARAVKVRKKIDLPALSRCFKQLLERHPALRTQFYEKDGIPYQKPLKDTGMDIDIIDAAGWPEENTRERINALAQQPFQLDQGGLAQLHVFRLDNDDILLFRIHHIIADLWSLSILIKELDELYAGAVHGLDISLQPVRHPFDEYIWYEQKLLSGKEGEALRHFWHQQLKAADGVLDFPADYLRPPVMRYRGAVISAALPEDVTRSTRAFARDKGMTVYVILAAAFHTLIHRYTGKNALIIGTPMANRVQSAFADTVAYLVNPVPLCSHFTADTTFAGLLAALHRDFRAAFKNQGYPFSCIVEDLDIKRDSSRMPLFQIMFDYYNPQEEDYSNLAAIALGQPGIELKLRELVLESYPAATGGAQFDLNVTVSQVNKQLVSTWEYNTDLFEAATIHRLARHFRLILEYMLENSTRPVAGFPLLTDTEYKMITQEWNNTYRLYHEEHILHHLFEKQVECFPGKTAVLDKNQTLSYSEFNRRANQLAWQLRKLGINNDDAVIIYMQRSPEMVIALYAVLKAGGAYVPIDLKYPQQRIEWIIQDTNPKIILTQPGQESALQWLNRAVLVVNPGGAGFDENPETNPDVPVTPENTAYIIYTSGSTGKPKGVMIPHRGICNRLLWMQEKYGLDGSDCILQKTPYTFDVSVWEFFWPLISGASLFIAEPEGHKDPSYLVKTIQTQHITTMHFVPSMLQPFLEEPGVKECTTLKRVFCSGEALSINLTEKFWNILPAELHNLYGPTEASVDVTYWECRPAPGLRRIPIGFPIANTQIYILDQNKQPTPVGVPGELYIGGTGLARGYINQPGLTAERFVQHPLQPGTGARLYKTGDLARYLPDGAIEFLGRIDHQVKIRGLRIELEEVEKAIQSHPGIADVVVVAKQDTRTGNQRLIAYYACTSSGMLTVKNFQHHLLKLLPDYMIPSQFVELDKLPLLPNGKIDRKALPDPPHERTGLSSDYVMPRSPAEKLLCEIFREVLEVNQVSILDSFFDLGGDSIMGLRVTARLRERGWEINLQELYSDKPVEELALHLKNINAGKTANESMQPFALLTPEDRAGLPPGILDAYPLSKLQAGLVFHSEYSPDYEIYVMGFHIRIPLDLNCINKALARLVQRHTMLRTAFKLVEYNEPIQLVHPEATVPVSVVSLLDLSLEAQDAEINRFIREEKYRKFDWTKCPFLRLHIHRRSADTQQFTFSHPLFDGWSMALIITEFFTLYGGYVAGREPVQEPGPRITYRDFVAHEKAALSRDEIRQYWEKTLADAQWSTLPRWPEHRKSTAGKHIRITVNVEPEILKGLESLGQEAGVPLKTVLLTAHLNVVRILSGKNDVITGLIANGRPETSGSDRVIGLFLNTIPIRSQMMGSNWLELLKATLEAERAALPYRHYPLAELVRTLGKGHQLFETAFNFIHFHIYQALQEVPDLSVLGWKSPSDQTYFPLTAYFHLDISTSGLLFFLDIDTGILAAQQIEAISGYYLNTLKAMAGNHTGHYKETCFLPASEHSQVTEKWNQTYTDTSSLSPYVHRRFSTIARSHSHSPAVTCNNSTLTYADLEAQSNALAHYLRDHGTGKNQLAAVMLNRSPALVIALLGVLKAGGAYVPLDPLYPQERLDFMLKDSGAQVVITESSLLPLLPQGSFRCICMDTDRQHLDACPVTAPPDNLEPADLAYVIYTSGSTGKPKGVEIPHKALGNFISAMEEKLRWNAGERLLAVTTVCFDIAGLEIYLPLTTGAHIILATDHLTHDAHALGKAIAEYKITAMQATPATWKMLVDTGWPGQTGLCALCGGEALPGHLARELLNRGVKLWNLYGPTETTIWSTVFPVKSADNQPLIGRPLANTVIYILDENKVPVPVGTAGELYIGGAGVARGYRNRPDLTGEKFLPDPFAPVPGGFMYRTGDLACYHPDGNIEYLGRMDNQVKVRGYRIELGEIETVINRTANVKTVVVDTRDDGYGENRIVAYIIPEENRTLTAGDLHKELSRFLPGYMIPSAFVFLKEFPLTPNGKVNRKALPQPEQLRPQLAEQYVTPETKLQQELVKIYCDVLHIDRAGIDDNFFDLGGHSLLLIRIHGKIQTVFNQSIPMVKLFEFPTIRLLAEFMEKQDTKLRSGESRHRADVRREWVSRQTIRRN